MRAWILLSSKYIYLVFLELCLKQFEITVLRRIFGCKRDALTGTCRKINTSNKKHLTLNQGNDWICVMDKAYCPTAEFKFYKSCVVTVTFT